jgi:hypothetical protein
LGGFTTQNTQPDPRFYLRNLSREPWSCQLNA